MNLLTFNGRTSSEFGVTISGEATWEKPAPKVERTTVPGRNGDLIMYTGAYENTTIVYHCGITDNFDQNYTAFINFLLSSQGYCRLTDSYHPSYYRMAAIESIGQPTLVKLYNAGEFDITFTCKPQTFLTSGEESSEIIGGGTLYVTNPTLYGAKPLLRVYGTGIFYVAGTRITISQNPEYIDMDCELEDAYYGSTNCNQYVTLSGDHFPVLPPGRKSIYRSSSTISKIVVTPRWWQL